MNAMANIPVGWRPANIAAANMQVPAWIRGDRQLTSLSATLCGMSPEETMGVSLRGRVIDVKSIVASKSLHEACHRDCAAVLEWTASLVVWEFGRGIITRMHRIRVLRKRDTGVTSI